MRHRLFFLVGILIAFAHTTALAQDPGVAVLPDSIMAPGTKITWVKKMVAYCEGPAVDGAGMLFFTQQRSRSTQEWPIWKINPSDPTDTGAIFLANSTQANGMNFDSHGRLMAAQNGKVTRYEANGAATVVATSGQGASFGLANDLSIAANGSFYFTDLNTSIFFVDSTGKLKVAYANAQGANGVELVAEKSLVYINEGFSNLVRRYHIGADGSLSNPETYVQQTGPDGLTIDAHGNFYVVSYTLGTINVFNAAGQKLGMITMTAKGSYDTFPGTEANCSNVAFGGPDNQTLFITGDGGVYSIQLKIPGRRSPGFPTALRNRSGEARIAPKGNPLRANRAGLRGPLIGLGSGTGWDVSGRTPAPALPVLP
jgi:gluconolactonase